jgi:uncharacterized protein YkwD
MRQPLRNLVLVCLTLGLLAATRAEEKPKEKPVDKFEMTPDEKSVLELTNAEREKIKLPPLKPNPLLFKIARAHSANMVKQDKLAHELDGKHVDDRLKDAGYNFAWYAENVAAIEEFSPQVVVKAWMDSKGHRENILSPRVTEIGIGLVKSAKDEVFGTQVFGKPARKR